jgi:hypothetical protein
VVYKSGFVVSKRSKYEHWADARRRGGRDFEVMFQGDLRVSLHVFWCDGKDCFFHNFYLSPDRSPLKIQ